MAKFKDYTETTTLSDTNIALFSNEAGTQSNRITKPNLAKELKGVLTAETKNANFTVESGINKDAFYYVATGAATITATIPAATVSDLGSIKTIVKSDAGSGKISTSGLDSGDLNITDQYGFISIICIKSGASSYVWQQIAGNTALKLFANTINTGNGDNELYAMNQNVRTTDSVTFATVNTGQGNNECYAMNQNVRTTDSPTFAGLTVGGKTLSVYIRDQAWPVGSEYIQFPGQSAPATLFGGTWTNKSNELPGDFIRFEGAAASSFNSGQQGDTFQGHYHDFLATGSNANTTAAYWSHGSSQTGILNASSAQAGNGVLGPITDGSNGTPRTGSETRPKNRTVRKWRRTA